MLTLIFGADNKSLTISILSYWAAKCNAVFLNKTLLIPLNNLNSKILLKVSNLKCHQNI